MRRHFTATGFVVRGGQTLLHWHKRLQQWMPPGGHLEPDEDPVIAVLREIREETGLDSEVIPLTPLLPFDYPRQISAPYTILLENSPEPGESHQHIDFIYFCRPLDGSAGTTAGDLSLSWVGESELRQDRPLRLPALSISAPIAEDVRRLALIAIETASKPEVLTHRS